MGVGNPEEQHVAPNEGVQSVDRGTTKEMIDRRQAISRMGKYAAYTAPTMLTLLLAESARAQDFGSPPPPPGESPQQAQTSGQRSEFQLSTPAVLPGNSAFRRP